MLSVVRHLGIGSLRRQVHCNNQLSALRFMHLGNTRNTTTRKFQPSFLTNGRLDALYYRRDLNVLLPAHGLDLQSVESHPEVLTNSEQAQRLLHLIGTGSADRHVSMTMSGGPAMPPNFLQLNNDLLAPVDRASRVGRIQAFLVELNLPPPIIRQIVLLLIRHNV